jgi:hypothetical protein
VGGWVVNATPRPLYLWERPNTHCMGGWVGSGAVLDGWRQSRPHRASIPVPSHYANWAIPTHLVQYDSRSNGIKFQHFGEGSFASTVFTDLLQRIRQHSASKWHCIPIYTASNPIRLKYSTTALKKRQIISYDSSFVCFAFRFVIRLI